jgi:membrane-bound metal-dependent hydrolase YbcI (DUF457 family)
VKGSVHAAIGATAPAALVVTQHISPMQGAVMAAISAGFSLLPDIDSPRATASTALGPVVHRFIHRLCKKAVDSTALGRDRSYIRFKVIKGHDPYHRTLTHTLAVAVILGLSVYGLALLGILSTALVAMSGVLLLWPLYRKTIGLVILGSALTGVGAALYLDPWLLAVAATGGYVSHIVADGCTMAGVPALWPLKIKGKRWWRFEILGRLIASGSRQEKGPAVGVALASNALLLLLGS